MRISLINIANKMPAWIVDGEREYLKRINHGKYSCRLIEIKAEKIPHKTSEENMLFEAEKIRRQIPDGSLVIVFDEKGKQFTSVAFAQKLEALANIQPNLAIIIGGADGVHPTLKKAAHICISLSSLTYPHALVRVIALEQIYRAITILEKHPYHRE